MVVVNSRKKCALSSPEIPLSFSLVDYRNNYFTSDDSNKIIEFYNSFDNRERLIQWMRGRPKGIANIHEVEGNKDIIVVIPTADFNGKYARECRENVFKGLHIIFVESGEVPDPYFNYAHNCNVGIKKAMEYNPDWVIVSNDDVFLEFYSNTLSNELSKLDNNLINVVLTPKSNQSSTISFVHRLRIFPSFFFSFLLYSRFYKFFQKKYQVYIFWININKRFGNKFFTFGKGKGLYNFFFKRGYTFFNIEAFGIISAKIIDANSGLFDETYINSHEDQDLSIRLYKYPERIARIDYEIIGVGKVSLSSGPQRLLRTIAGEAYLNYKIEYGLLNDNLNSVQS